MQLDQVLGTLQTNTRKDLQNLLVGYGEALNGQPQPGEDDDQDPDTKGETGGEALNDSLEYSTDALRGSAIVNQATLGTELHDISKLIAGPAEGHRGALQPGGQPQGPDHELEHHHDRAGGPGDATCPRPCASCPRCSRRRGRRWTT